MTKEKRNYAKRDASEFNKFRAFWQVLVCGWIYGLYCKIVYKMEIHGLENVPEDNKYIVCPNHLTSLDPPLICGVMPRRVSFMAKRELFDSSGFFIRWWMDWLGGFAVDREKLAVSTMKTAMSLTKTDWVLGLFPQGTRGEFGVIKNVSKGFANLAKITKCGVLPVGIIVKPRQKNKPFSGKIIIKIGKIIPYSDNIDEMVNQWGTAVAELTGFKYEV